MIDTRFVMGLAAGVILCWAVHHYAMPLPGPNTAAKKKGASQ